MSRVLTRVVSWGHEFLAEVIEPGQLVVDLTAGNGHDTLMLQQLVGPTGQVIAFDIQSVALQNTQQRLAESGVASRRWQAGQAPIPSAAGVDLVAAGHQDLQGFLPTAPQGIIANLGYFPSGDRQIVTQPETTLRALQQSCKLLAPGGRLAVVVYTGHQGGQEEGAAVDGFFSDLNRDDFQTLQLKVTNRPEAPYLQVAEKRC